MTKDRAEMWAASLGRGDRALEVAQQNYAHEQHAVIAQAHYLRAIAIQLDGIRRALVEHAHDRPRPSDG